MAQRAQVGGVKVRHAVRRCLAHWHPLWNGPELGTRWRADASRDFV